MNSGPLRRAAHGRVQAAHRRRVAIPRAKAARRSTTSSAIGSSAASTSGASRFPSCTNWARTDNRTGGSAAAARRPAGRSARAHDVRRRPRSPRAAAGGGPGRLALRHPRRQALQARDEHDAAMGRLLLVLPPLPRSRTTTATLVDPAVEKAWMPVDLYVGGAEHAVLHLLYARFWHKVLFDRGYVSTPEPFQKLVNQGMILGEMEFTAYKKPNGEFQKVSDWTPGIVTMPDGTSTPGTPGETLTPVRIPVDENQERRARRYVLDARHRRGSRQPGVQDVEEPRQRGQSRPGGERIRRRRAAAVRDVHGPAGGREALEHGRRQRRARLPRPGVADDRR